jgi:catechol 2,3-dioxygenase-like lactoylglutathione lyase family enzyme
MINSTNVTIMVNDMDRGISFYQSIGLNLKQRWDNHYAMMTAPGLTIGLHPTEDKNPNSGTISIGFMINSIDEAKALLEQKNIPYTGEDDGKSGIYLHFKDPYGTVLYFVQPKWQ